MKKVSKKNIPNVKFIVDLKNEDIVDFLGFNKINQLIAILGRDFEYGCTNPQGSIFYTNKPCFENDKTRKLISIYEAIPKLIPDGMRYNKELDKLVPDIISASDEYCSGIKIHLKEDLITNHRAYNIGSSNYASLKIQPWDVWKDWKLDPWDADIIKRISRTKEIPGKTFEEARIEDYEKIKHICDEKIYQLKEKNKC